MQSESPSIDLNGLPIFSSPIGFMAALGLLRVCVQDHGLPVQLSWTDMHARLHGIARGDLTALLRLHMRDRALAPEFNFKVTGAKGSQGPVQHLREIRPQDFRDAAVEFRGSQRALDFLAGFAADAVVNDKGFVARTRLDFTSGQQRIAEESVASLCNSVLKAVKPTKPVSNAVSIVRYSAAPMRRRQRWVGILPR